jgi:Fe-S oxidoreductase
MEHEELLHRCFRCGWCKLPTNFADINCPSYLKYRFETYSPGGRMWLIRAYLNGEIKLTPRLQEIIFSCTTCRNCVEACAIPKIKDYLVDIIVAARHELVGGGVIPPTARKYFMGINNYGNAFARHANERMDWVKSLPIPIYGGHEYLLYVGDEGAFDEVGARMARSVASWMLATGISFGVLGEAEITDGNDVKALGEKDLFEHVAQENIGKFNTAGVKKIITLSPHAFNTMKSDYPALGGAFAVYHYTQVMDRRRGAKTGAFNARVAYHDPCYLGRWNQEYLAPRNILQSVKGLKLIELDRAMSNALCCGGGGGNYYTDILGSGADSPARNRIREAGNAGVEIIAVSCPICYKMLDDALKDEGLEDRMKVMEISEILTAAGDA